MKKVLNVDIETYSSEPITNGVYRYVEAPDFDILIIAYSVDGGEVKAIDCSKLHFTEEKMKMIEFCDALYDENVLKTAFNANFERTCIAKRFGVPQPPEQWSCTMVDARRLGLPASLEKCAEVLNVEDKKDKAGKALINYFSVPCKPTKVNGGRTRNLPKHDMDKWNMFVDYCIQDVKTERAIRDKIKVFEVTPSEQKAWELDQHINDTGVEIDLELMNGAVALDMKDKAELMEEARHITGLSNPNSPSQLKAWFSERGLELPNMTKGTISDALSSAQGEVKRMLEIRQALSKTSVKKYTKMQDMACKDGRVRGVFQFYGAGTGRWAGRGVQLQNLTKHKMPDAELPIARETLKEQDFEMLSMLFDYEPSSILSQLVRTCFIAGEGKTFIVSDFSAIEGRVTAWFSNEKWRKEVFESHAMLYEASASKMFGVPLEDIKKGGPREDLRAKGKVTELALGYQGGPGALIAMGALEGGVKEEELQGLVDAWRRESPNIVDFWYSVQDCAIKAVETGQEQYTNRCRFKTDRGFLFITLPSGRKLAYPKPHLGINKFNRKSLKFWGINSVNKKWEVQDTYGGKLVENIVQATARDILSEAMLRLHDAGYKVVMHVHDEIVVEVPDFNRDKETVEREMKKMTDIMEKYPEWWTEGVPLSSEAFVEDFYKK